jgi:hypothetical protein
VRRIAVVALPSPAYCGRTRFPRCRCCAYPGSNTERAPPPRTTCETRPRHSHVRLPGLIDR